MSSLVDYSVDTKIYESENSLVFRGRDLRRDRPVILKFLKQDYPTPDEAARYRQEFEITSTLHVQGVIGVYEQFPLHKSLVMVLEDFGGESLSVLMRERPFSLEEAISLGARIADTLGRIHEQAVIHKDINPNNVVYCRSTDTLKIIDFGISTRLPRQNAPLTHPHRMEGTIAYMSPEQTGRMSRYLDYRSDFYSLGATLYEMLCGAPPFVHPDSMTLVHSLLAKQPRPPHEVNANVPVVVSQIVLKLLAKNAEDRYASGWGIAADLRSVLSELQAGRSPMSFALGKGDVSGRLTIPQKLYGREAEIQRLLESFGRASRGRAELVLVSGYSGIGKSSLVQEIHKPIALLSGYYVSGKFDQLRRIPYGALRQALSALIRQVLTESEAALDRWRKRLQAALGADAQVVIDIVPELMNVLGPQAPAEELGPAETNLRLRRLLIAFLAQFCQPEHPLVMFIDDLQWADGLSIELIEAVICDGSLSSLLIVGAYRDNEVNALHPVSMMRNVLRDAGRSIEDVQLRDIEERHLVDLLADTLDMPANEVEPLATLIKRKTGGNPFFIGQLLHALHADGLLVFQPPGQTNTATWTWDLARIEAVGFSDNVVDLMIVKLRQLPLRAQEALRLAACLGNQFDVDTLGIIAETSLQTAFADLQPAAHAGFVLPMSKLVTVAGDGELVDLVSHEYRFLHDRVQQAAYALIPDSRKQAIHARIGQLLLANISPEKRNERLFEIVDHLNKGEIPADRASRIELAQLNLDAARKAKQSAAFEASRQYIAQAVASMPDDLWESHHALAMEISTLHVELESIAGHCERAEALAEVAVGRARTTLEKATLYRLLINQRTVLSQYKSALDLGLVALSELGVDFPSEGLTELLFADHAEIGRHLAGKPVASLVELDHCTVPEVKLAISLLSSLMAVAHQFNPPLMTVIATRSVKLSIAHGNHPDSVLGYLAYGITLVAVFEEYTLGYEYGNLAFAVAEKFNDRTQTCRATNVVVAHLRHWARPLSENEALVKRGFQAGIEVGEQQYASYILSNHATNSLVSGERLDDLERRIVASLEYIKKSRTAISLAMATGVRLIVANLRGETDAATPFDYDGVAESAMLETASKGNIHMAICEYEIAKAQVFYYDGRYEEAYSLLREAGTKLSYITGCTSLSEYHFYLALVLAARYPDAEPDVQRAWLEELDKHVDKFALFTKHCAANFQHKLFLVRAERARITGRPWDAIEDYDQAIERAAANGFIQDEALAHYLAGMFWLSRGKHRIGEAYLVESHQCFRDWGARRIAGVLEARHPHILSRRPRRSTEHTSTGTTTTTGEFVRKLDLDTVVKASRAITNEHNFSALLVKVMQISLENAGAERGLLIIERDGELLVKARGTLAQAAQIELLSTELATYDEVCQGLVHYVARTGEPVVLDDARNEGMFTADPYVQRVGGKSFFCVPLLNQGSLIAIVYMENHKMRAAFTKDRMDVLELLMTPAAIAIENALLKNVHDASRFEYQIGGSLPADSSSYVMRRADRELYHALRAGQFCYVLCPRQMGKSSLRVRTMGALGRDRITCVSLDLTSIGSRDVTAEQWYAGIARGLLGQLGLTQAVPLRPWWREHDHLSPVQRLIELFDKEILERVATPIVVFIDEIDSVTSLQFDTDDFFAMIRSLFNQRADDVRYNRLTFVLLGVVSPAQLIRDAHRTPFNVGQSVHLDRFRPIEIQPLLTGLSDKCDARVVLQSVLAWTGGQPFLTQKVCHLLRTAETAPLNGQESMWVGKAVLTHVIANWEMHDEPVHFRTIQERILRSPLGPRALLERYEEIFLHSGEVPSTGSPVEDELLLSGLVIRENGMLHVGNRIYEKIFGRNWIDQLRPQGG